MTELTFWMIIETFFLLRNGVLLHKVHSRSFKGMLRSTWPGQGYVKSTFGPWIWKKMLRYQYAANKWLWNRLHHIHQLAAGTRLALLRLRTFLFQLLRPRKDLQRNKLCFELLFAFDHKRPGKSQSHLLLSSGKSICLHFQIQSTLDRPVQPSYPMVEIHRLRHIQNESLLKLKHPNWK